MGARGEEESKPEHIPIEGERDCDVAHGDGDLTDLFDCLGHAGSQKRLAKGAIRHLLRGRRLGRFDLREGCASMPLRGQWHRRCLCCMNAWARWSIQPLERRKAGSNLE